MGASRKLQGEIDRVLKKVQEGVDVFDSIWNKVYDTDNANQKEKLEADLKKEIKKLQRYRDQIKTWIQSSEIKDKKVSASYEQALMDARKLIEREMERFKICEKETKTKAFSKEGLGQQPKTLENQIDNFEAELEGLLVKKGSKGPKIDSLDNDELSPEQVNDVKDFLEDYVERNREDFDEFSDVDELYSTLPLDKVESLEDLVTIGPPGLVKGVTVASAVLSVKNSLASSPAQASVAVTSSAQQAASVQDQVDEAASQDSSSETVVKTPPPKSSAIATSAPTTPAGSHSTQGAAAAALSPTSVSNAIKEDDLTSFPGRKPSPARSDTTLRGVSRGALSNQPVASIALGSSGSVTGNGGLGASPSASEVTKRNILVTEERLGSSSMGQPLVSPLANRMMMSQAAKATDGIGVADGANLGDATVMTGRVFSPSVGPDMQWRPGSSFQNQNEAGQFRGRTEIVPDQREKFLQRFQQVQQPGQSNLLGIPPFNGGNLKQFSSQKHNPLLPQFNSHSSSVSPQLGLGVGAQAVGINNIASSTSLQQQPDDGHSKANELQPRQILPEDSSANAGLGKNLLNEDDKQNSYGLDTLSVSLAKHSWMQGGVTGSVAEASPRPRDTDLSPGQPLQSSQPSGSLGFIGRKSVADFGAIGDNLSASSANSGGMHDQLYNLQMLESSFYKLPQPKDSERAKSYTPRHPSVTPTSYPQVQSPIVNNSAFWERLGADNYATDTLFFAFYYLQNTYQQYLAAKELKKQSWRYHRKYNTWFQRHEEPTVAADDFEQGTYVYFDFHIANDEQHGWCQRIKQEFTFEYNYLEDELIV
ncbi:unnamed protein product [Withania somnifera]